MLIIGCDFHPSFQQVAIFDNRTGEIEERRLQHREEAEQFYRSLAGQEVRVGMEAFGHYPGFERLLEELGIELWFGDCGAGAGFDGAQAENGPAGRGASAGSVAPESVSADLGAEPGGAGCAAVAGASAQAGAGATRTKNQLQAMALSCGVQKKRKLWTKAGRAELEKLPLLPYAAERPKRLLEALDGL